MSDHVRAIFDRHGEPVASAVIAGRLYVAGAPAPADAVCAVCWATIECHCAEPLAREWDPARFQTES